MKIAYTENLKLGPANKERLETINQIIEKYVDDGYVMTLRQLYYQLVQRNIIPNVSKEYAKLSTLLKQGRMAGIVDWDAIEDRGRQPKIPWSTSGIAGALKTIHDQYRLDRMQEQEYYIEIWVEKDALSNVMRRVTEKYHVNLMVNKGYSSCSAMHESYWRFKESEKPGVLLYFGDHDPSGKDMVRDIEDRMREFGLGIEYNFNVQNPALNMDQVRRYRLPENPAKITDPRAAEYIRQYGNKSWELDALEPPVLVRIIEDAILEYIDMDKYKDMLFKEKTEKLRLMKMRTDFDDYDGDEPDPDEEDQDEDN